MSETGQVEWTTATDALGVERQRAVVDRVSLTVVGLEWRALTLRTDAAGRVVSFGVEGVSRTLASAQPLAVAAARHLAALADRAVS